MCGITGYFSFNHAVKFEQQLSKAVSALKHRGPDHTNFHVFDKAGIGHTRLSVIDLSVKAMQPMFSRDQRFVISFNGEIYNFKDVRRQLIQKGARFYSESDTEVVLKGYELMGKGILDILHGMFAFAIYDSFQHELFLARDRFGIKPLYFYQNNDTIFFASELGALLEYPIPRILEKSTLANYLRFNFAPENRSFIEGVRQVVPGYYHIFKPDNTFSFKYYSIESEKRKIDLNTTLSNIKHLLQLSVKERLMSDVPIGSFLSGGVDSSVITLMARKEIEQWHTFSAGFSEHSFFDESAFALRLAKDLNTQHHHFDLDKLDIQNEALELLDGLSEPFADSSSLAYYMLAKETSKHAKVVLSGDGADELFGGYRRHKAEWFLQTTRGFWGVSGLFDILTKDSGSRNHTIGNTKRQIKKWLKGIKLSSYERYLLWSSFLSQEELSRLITFGFNGEGIALPFIESLNDVLESDMQHTLPGDMLTKVDRTSMLFGLEVRTPFLDHFLVNQVFSIPSLWKLRYGRRKYLLMKAMESDLPSYIFKRKKQGFEVPLWYWINKPLQKMVKDRVYSNRLIESGLFNMNYIDFLFEKCHSENPGDTPYTLWALTVFSHWMEKYKPSVQ